MLHERAGCGRVGTVTHVVRGMVRGGSHVVRSSTSARWLAHVVRSTVRGGLLFSTSCQRIVCIVLVLSCNVHGLL